MTQQVNKLVELLKIIYDQCPTIEHCDAVYTMIEGLNAQIYGAQQLVIIESDE